MLDPVGRPGVAPVQHGGEEVFHQGDIVVRDAGLFQEGCVVVDRCFHEAQVASACGGNFLNGVGEAQQARAGYFVELPDMARVGQRRRHHVGDVVGIDKGFLHAADGQGELTRRQPVKHEAFAEILREPACAHDGPIGAARLEHLFGALRFLFPAARQQDQSADSLFQSDRGELAHRIHRAGDGIRVAVKGAPEAVLEAATAVMTEDGEVPLDDALRNDWRERNDALAREGFRALAVAQKTVSDDGAEPYEKLTLIGLVGLYDPPRGDVEEAIRACREAGIKVVMITGEQPATAVAIARAVGLVDRDAEVEAIKGSELKHAAEMSEEERRRVLEAKVFARVDPAQKLDLIQIHQDNGARVAMTGDGINDAPALKKADIGIAMGKRGTQVAREAAHMVLRDDSFATIVMAVAQGRVIFNNIRRFIVYMLSGNTGEIFAVGLVALLAGPLPLLPLQILYINIITDVFPALALGVGRGENTLDQPARDPKEPILTRRHWYAIGGYGILIGGSVLAIFAYCLLVAGMSQERAVTISFVTFALARLWHVFNMRDAGSNLLRNTVTTNIWVWGAILVGVLLILAALYVPVLAEVLNTVEPGPDGWLLIALGSLVPLVVGQLLKLRPSQKAVSRP